MKSFKHKKLPLLVNPKMIEFLIHIVIKLAIYNIYHIFRFSKEIALERVQATDTEKSA